MFQDYLLYATDLQTQYAFRVVHLSHLVQEAATRHQVEGVSAKLLAEMITSGVLLASILETEERVNLRIQCGSEFTLASETTCHGQTRGYIESTPGSEALRAIEDGKRPSESVIVRSLRSIPKSTKLNEGVTRSIFDSTEQVVNEHIEQSFQAKARLKIESWFDDDNKLRAFGVIYLRLPGLDEAAEEKLGTHVARFKGFKEIGPGLEDPDVLFTLLAPDAAKVVNTIKPSWQCTCSLPSVEGMLLSLPLAELLQMSESVEPTVISCHYCNTDYKISNDRLRDLSLSKSSESQAKHVDN